MLLIACGLVREGDIKAAGRPLDCGDEQPVEGAHFRPLEVLAARRVAVAERDEGGAGAGVEEEGAVGVRAERAV